MTSDARAPPTLNTGLAPAAVGAAWAALDVLIAEPWRAQAVLESVREDLEFSSEGIVAEPQILEGDTYYSAVTALQNDAGFPVAYLVLSSPSRIVTTAREDVTRTLFLVALGVGAIVLMLAYYSGSRITRPIQTLTDTAQRIREGDLKAQADVAGEDEVGQLTRVFKYMIDEGHELVAATLALERGADAQPGGQHQADLCPAEHPRDGANGLHALRGPFAVDGARSELNMRELLHRRRLEQHLEDRGILMDECPVDGQRLRGQAVHHLAESSFLA